jgi:NAD-dependent DNA ligase
MEKRFIELSWIILEHKCRYYHFNAPIIKDYEYDMLEKEYDALATQLGKPQSASNMVDFKLDRPACRAVLDKIRNEVTRG